MTYTTALRPFRSKRWSQRAFNVSLRPTGDTGMKASNPHHCFEGCPRDWRWGWGQNGSSAGVGCHRRHSGKQGWCQATRHPSQSPTPRLTQVWGRRVLGGAKTPQILEAATRSDPPSARLDFFWGHPSAPRAQGCLAALCAPWWAAAASRTRWSGTEELRNASPPSTPTLVFLMKKPK